MGAISRASIVPRNSAGLSKGHVHDGSNGSSNGKTNDGVNGGDGVLISSQDHHAPGVGRAQGGSSRGLCFAVAVESGGGSDDGGNAMAAPHQQAALAGLGIGVGVFNLGLGSPGLSGMPNRHSMKQLTQLNGMNGMNPFRVYMNMLGMANLSAMGISPVVQLLATQIAAAGGGFVQPGIGGLGSFGGRHSAALVYENGPRRSGGCRKISTRLCCMTSLGGCHGTASQGHAELSGHAVERYGSDERAGTRGARCRGVRCT